MVMNSNLNVLTLTPEQVKKYPSDLWVKDVPTKIRPLTQDDVEEMGPIFLDLEQRPQEVSTDRFLCVGPFGEQWTTSKKSLERDREAISLPDKQGFRLYKMKNPKKLICFDIPHPFALDTSNLHRWIRMLNRGNSGEDTSLVRYVLKIVDTFYKEPLWKCENPSGGYVTWNGLEGKKLSMRVNQRATFEQTYKRVE